MAVGSEGLSSMFNTVTIGSVLFSVAFEVGMHIFVHYTIPGMAFAANVADFLGVTADLADAADMAEVVTKSGEEVFTFSDLGPP